MAKNIVNCYQNNVAWLYSPDLNPIEHKWAQAKSKKREWLRYRDFVLSPYGVIKIKSLGYNKRHQSALSAIPDRVRTR
ncbi:hypothetical protein [Symbiopectobacterium sp. RP]|uniref:hypothetical protein n=1 Tax=Symbiopectobacterium sp. RP TaxID=3248553 RepID=UPI003D2AE447